MKKRLISLTVLLFLLSCLTVSVFANPIRMVDMAGLLTAGEVASLEEEFAWYRENEGLDVVVVTVDSLGGKSAQAFADDFFDYGGYGENGILLLVAMAEREWHISTCGTAITLVDDADLIYLEDRIVPHLAEGDYYEAFYQFQYSLPGCIAPESPADNLIFSVPIGLVIALVAVLLMRGTMNTRQKQRAAEAYETDGGFHLRVQQDLFLYSNVTKVPKPKENTSSGSRGSTTHVSSSGRSHGGRGGKF